MNILEKFSIPLTVENVLSKLENQLTYFREKYRLSKSEVFKVSPKIMMNLLMTFESYDNQVVKKDMIMPEEKLINFNVGYLKLQFKGVLRITIDRDNLHAKNEDGPNLAYGIVEKHDLLFKIDKPVIAKSFYIRPNVKAHKSSTVRAIEFGVMGLKGDMRVWESRKITNIDSREWVNISFKI